MRSVIITLSFFIMLVNVTSEVLTLNGDVIDSGAFSVNGGPAIDFSGTPYILKLEIDAALTTFTNNQFDASGEIVVLGFSLIFPGIGDVFTADVTTIDQGLRDIDAGNGLNLLTDGNSIRPLPRDVNELGPALDGENLAEYFTRTGGNFTSENQVIIAGGVEFTNLDGDTITVAQTIIGSRFNNVTVSVPEPTTYLVLILLGFCAYIRKRKA